mgnify:CR=1 FL=1
MTSFIIGDVHGMKPELVALIETLKPTVEDEITFVGDLVDKGDDSPGVVRFVRELSLTHNVVLVEGNHEDKHKRFRRNLTVRPEVAAQQAERSPELSEITAGLSEADVAFLDSAVPFHRVAKHGILVVHGGIPGDMVEFPATVEEAMSFTGKAKRRMEKILRTRTIDAETGKFIAGKLRLTPSGLKSTTDGSDTLCSDTSRSWTEWLTSPTPQASTQVLSSVVA